MTSPPDFYRAFEDRHRGSAEAIEARQRAWLPFLAALPKHAKPSLVDVGCGRGEWLALAQANGWAVRGVDTDAAMLRAARDARLDVHEGDAIAFLRGLPEHSVDALTAFHVVEHLPFDNLRALLAEALRALRPGGLLILETPNPENLVVGSSAFHTDPTHVRPLPPALLAFAVEFTGFDRVSTLRLHEGIDESRAVELIDVLAGVSPDYAVVARSPGGGGSAELDALLAAHRGVTLNELAERYDAQLRELRISAETAREAALRLSTSRRDLLARLEALEAGAALLGETGAKPAPLRERVLQAREHIGALEYKVAAMQASTSWRLTAPLRRLGEWRIRIANAGHAALAGNPALHRCVRAIARGLRLVPQAADVRPVPVPPAGAHAPEVPPAETHALTAAARTAYASMQEVRAAEASKEH